MPLMLYDYLRKVEHKIKMLIPEPNFGCHISLIGGSVIFVDYPFKLQLEIYNI